MPTVIELIWTISPAIVLIFIAFPSFKLLFLVDDVPNACITVNVTGHQWYWSYRYPDFATPEGDCVEFDSYLLTESDLDRGQLRKLDTDNLTVVPTNYVVRFLLESGDVIHAFAVPALGLKVDVYPGRINEMSFSVNRDGVYYGQCSEICGVLHSSMPIVIKATSLEDFLSFIQNEL